MSLTEVKEAVAQMTLDEVNELTRWINEQRVKAEEADFGRIGTSNSKKM